MLRRVSLWRQASAAELLPQCGLPSSVSASLAKVIASNQRAAKGYGRLLQEAQSSLGRTTTALANLGATDAAAISELQSNGSLSASALIVATAFQPSTADLHQAAAHHFNLCMSFNSTRLEPGTAATPSKELRKALPQRFDSELKTFLLAHGPAGGWTWLIYNPHSNAIELLNTTRRGTHPLALGAYPIAVFNMHQEAYLNAYPDAGTTTKATAVPQWSRKSRVGAVNVRGEEESSQSLGEIQSTYANQVASHVNWTFVEQQWRAATKWFTSAERVEAQAKRTEALKNAASAELNDAMNLAQAPDADDADATAPPTPSGASSEASPVDAEAPLEAVQPTLDPVAPEAPPAPPSPPAAEEGVLCTDGSRLFTLGDGTREFRLPNGDVTVERPNGEKEWRTAALTTIAFPDQRILYKYPGGITMTIFPQGSEFKSITQYADGTTTQEPW